MSGDQGILTALAILVLGWIFLRRIWVAWGVSGPQGYHTDSRRTIVSILGKSLG